MDITLWPMMVVGLIQEAASSVGTGEVGAGVASLSLAGVVYKIVSDIMKERKARPVARELVNGGGGNPGHSTNGTAIQLILTTLGHHTKEISKMRGEMSKMAVDVGRIEERLKMRREEDRP